MTIHHYTLLVIATRLALVLGKPTFHHFFHKSCEHGIHTVLHKCKTLKAVSARFTMIPDMIMIVILIGLDLGIELFGSGGE